MRRAVALVFAVTAMLAASIAAADTPPEQPVAIAASVNSPLSWHGSFAIAGTLQVGFGGHHAIRANVGRFAHHQNIGLAIATLLVVEDDGDGPVNSGRMFDVGVGYQYFPRRLWSGPSLEAGVLRRDVETAEDLAYNGPEHLGTDTVGYGVRGLVGWSWLWAHHVVLATGVGLSVGRYSGREAVQRMYDSPVIVSPVARMQVEPEFFLRIGGAFSL